MTALAGRVSRWLGPGEPIGREGDDLSPARMSPRWRARRRTQANSTEVPLWPSLTNLKALAP